MTWVGLGRETLYQRADGTDKPVNPDIGLLSPNVGLVIPDSGLLSLNVSLISPGSKLVDTPIRFHATLGERNHGLIETFDVAGKLIESPDHLIHNPGQFTYSAGQLIDNPGQLIDSSGQFTYSAGQLIDSPGQPTYGASQLPHSSSKRTHDCFQLDLTPFVLSLTIQDKFNGFFDVHASA